MTPMTLQDFVEIDAIHRLKYAYFRCVDQKLWDELATLLTDDVTARYSGGRYAYNGRDNLIAWMRSTMESDTFHTSHRASHPEIELLSDTEARGVWAFDDTVIEMKYDVTMRGAGFYDDRYRKVDGRWLIAETGYKRTFEDVESRDGSGTKLSASWWTTDGISKLKH